MKRALLSGLFPSLWTAVLGLVVVTAGGCKKPGAAAAGALNTDDDKALYALGTEVGQSLKSYKLTPAELALVKDGLDDSVNGKDLKADPNTYRQKLMELMHKRQQAAADAEKTHGKEVVDKAATESGAEKLPSGLVFKMLKPGTGPSPTADDTVKVNYEGKLIDGTVFDSSYKRNQPVEFPLHGVIKCWTEGVQKLAVGGKAKLTCPSDIAYGERGRPPTIPGNATLIFEVELLEIMKK